jgi:hypothetical protein
MTEKKDTVVNKFVVPIAAGSAIGYVLAQFFM